jgi:hypothetical protein
VRYPGVGCRHSTESAGDRLRIAQTEKKAGPNEPARSNNKDGLTLMLHATEDAFGGKSGRDDKTRAM